MRLPLAMILPALVVVVLVDTYICCAVWRRCKRHSALWRNIVLWSSVVFAALLIVMVLWPKSGGSNDTLVDLMWGLFSYLTVYAAKIVFVGFDLIAGIPRLFGYQRFKWLSKTGIVLALVTFAAMWWGALVNRYNINVVELTVERADVPEAFDGLRIMQFSDLHTGSFGTDTSFVAALVDSINARRPDIVLFTGDIVNRKSDELKPFIPALSRIKAPVYSVLGNHDYGDYYRWPSVEAKEANMVMLKQMQHDMGWELLDNRAAMLKKGNDSLAIIGVGNIGDPPFHVYGDLDRANAGIDANTFKILMSHNPAHWQNDIEDSAKDNIALTLAGHTHAMQIEVAGLSPAAWRYKYWKGLHPDRRGQLLYVNIGSGEVGMPARIGAAPELTLITLKRSK